MTNAILISQHSCLVFAADVIVLPTLCQHVSYLGRILNW